MNQNNYRAIPPNITHCDNGLKGYLGKSRYYEVVSFAKKQLQDVP